MRLSILAALAVGLAVIVSLAGPSDAATNQRTYTAQSCVLQIDKEAVDVRRAEGGDPRAQVAAEKSGKKHVAGVTFQPLRASIAPDDFTGFLADSLADNPRRVNGALQYVDFDRKVQQQIDFQNAILTELTVPELSGENKTGGDLIIAIQPETVRTSSGSGNAAGGAKGPKQKHWAGGFKISIPGMNTSRVRKVETFTLKRGIAQNTIGEQRDYEKAPATWQIPNLVFYIAGQDAGPFQQWLDDFVVKGNNDDSKEKTLDIELLDASMKGSLLTLNCSGVGIVGCTLEPADPAGGQPGSVRVEVYVERITIPAAGAAKNAAAAPPPPETPAAAPAPAAAAPADAAKTAEPAPAAVKARKKRPAAAPATPTPPPPQ